MEKLGRRELLASALGALTACGVRRDPYAIVAKEPLPLGVGLGSETRVRTTCGYCPATCPMETRVVEGRVVRLDGVGGPLCPMGLAATQGVYHSRRVPSPLARVGGKGSLSFRSVTVDEAIDQVAGKLSQASGASGGVAVARGMLSAGQLALLDRLVAGVGGAGAGSPLDSDRAITGDRVALSALDYDFSASEYVLAVGPACTVPSRHWPAFAKARSQQRRPLLGGVASRFALLGAKPDDAFLVKPGAEALFLLGLAHALCHLHAKGDVQQVVALLAPFTPDKVAPRAGISPQAVLGLADRLGTMKAMVVLDETSADPATATASVLLNQLLGAWGTRVRAARSYPFPAWPEVRTVAAAPSAASSKVLLLAGDGAGQSLPNSRLADASFVVAFASTLDSSLAHADLVLPLHHFLEDWDIHPLGQSGKTLILRRPVVLPRHASRGLGDWVLAIANRLGLSSALPWENYKAALAAGMPMEAFDVLMNLGRYDVSGPTEASDPSPANRPDPARFALPATLLSPSAPSPEFPFVLLPAWEGVRPMDLSWVRELPIHPGNPTFLRVEMGMADAERLGLRDGEPVVVETRARSWSGRLRIRAGLSDGALALADAFATGAARIRMAS